MKTNGARDVVCFDCRNSRSVDGMVEREGGGYHHQYTCAKGLHQPDRVEGVPDVEIVQQCPGGDPRFGFQIGGYYSHMWLEGGSKVPCEPKCPGAMCQDGCKRESSCMTWCIASDGEFPTKDGEPGITFHVCDWHQIERFVAFWGKELRRRGWVRDSPKESGNVG